MSKIYAFVKYRCVYASGIWRRLFIITALFLMGAGGVLAQGPGAGWEFYRELTLSAATPMADFQVKVMLNGAAQHVHMKADGGDLRFYSADGSVKFDYFLEKFDPAGLSVIWVKVPAAGVNMLRMYYGNPAAADESDGEAVFDFFDGFEGSALNSSWEQNTAGGTITVNDGHVKLETTNDNVVGIAHLLTYGASDTNIVEVKHKDGAYFRNRYFATNYVDINSAKNTPTNDYGYFVDGFQSALTGYLFFFGWDKSITLTYNKNYITSWRWPQSSDSCRWLLTDFENQNEIKSNTFRIPDVHLNYISVTLAESVNTSTSLDWVRTRKGPDILASLNAEQYILPLPHIAAVPLSVCENEVITITGTGFLTSFPTTVSIGGIEATNVIVNPNGTEISVKVSNGETGKLKIISGGRVVESASEIIVHLIPSVNITTVSEEVCQGSGPITLKAELGGGAVGVEWTSSISGGTFDNKNNANTTWTPPSGFSGDIQFTISTSGSGCSETQDVLTYGINPLPTAIIESFNSEPRCKGENVRVEVSPGYYNYNFKINGNAIQSGPHSFWESTALPSRDVNIVSITVSTEKGCSVELNTEEFGIYAQPSGEFFADESSGTANNFEICEGAEVSLSYSGTTKSIGFSFFVEDINGVRTDLNTNKSDSTFTFTGILTDRNKFGVEVTGRGNCKSTFYSPEFTVHSLPEGEVTPAHITVCEGDAAIFNVSDNFLSYQWYLNNNILIDSTSKEIALRGLNTGDEVSVRVTNANHCSVQFSPASVTVNELPQKPVITGSGEFCAGSTTLISVPAVYVSYQWYKDGVLIIDSTRNILTVGDKGNYSVAVSDAHCSVFSESFVINELAVPDPPVITSVSSFCEGGTLTLTSSYTLRNQWYRNETEVGGASQQTYETETDGDFTVQYTDANGCSSMSAVKSIVKNTLPAVPVITINASAETDVEFCDGESRILEAPAGFSYQWYSEGGLLAGATERTLEVSQSGKFKIVITNENGCESESGEVVVTSNPLPNPIITASQDQICPGSTITYSTISGMQTYSWMVPEGESYTSINESTISITWSNTTGLKNVRVSVTDFKGCSSQGENQPAEITELTPTIIDNFIRENVCQNDIISYSTEGGFENYLWEVTGGVVDGTDTTNTIKVKWSGSGERKVSVNYTEIGTGCQSPTPGIKVVTVNPLPDAVINGAATVCEDAASPKIAFTGSGGTAPYIFEYYIIHSGQTGEPKTTVPGNPGFVNVDTNEPGELIFNMRAVEDDKGCRRVFNDPVPSTTVTVTEKPVVIDFDYGESSYCNNLADSVAVNFLGTPGGVFSASSNLKLHPVSGNFNPSASASGNYTVTYKIAAHDGCAELVRTASVSIAPLPVINKFYYGSEFTHNFCNSTNSIISPVITGDHLAGGKYSVSGNFEIDENSGKFNPVTQTPGTYTIAYTIAAANGCEEVTAQTEVTITPVPDAQISYNSPSCSSDETIPVILTGTPGGTFNISSGGATINPANGTVNANNAPGTYSVTYRVFASGGCNAFQTTTNLIVNPKPEISAGGTILMCEMDGAMNIGEGASAKNYSTLVWSSGGDGTWENENSLNGAIYTPGPNDISNNTVSLSLTVNQEGCSPVTAGKSITINANPTAVVLKPEETNICLDAIAPLTSVKEKVLTRVDSFSNQTNVNIPDNFAPGTNSKVVVSGIPGDAIIDSIRVRINVDHPSIRQLVSNLRSPLGKELNLFYRIPQEGEDFTNTTISSGSIQPIQTFGSPPFEGNYAPQAQIASMGLAFAKTFSDLYTNSATVNGEWTLKIADNIPEEVGNLLNWSLQFYYSVPEEAIAVVWSPSADLYLDAAATQHYNGESVATVYAKPSSAAQLTFTATNANSAGCTTASTVTVNVKPSPGVKIKTDYCLNPGYATLTAEPQTAGNFEFNWNTAETTETVLVDIANDYYVSVTDKNNGCVGTAVMSIATELVVNGDFEQGNVGFYTDYEFVETKGQYALYEEGKYTVDADASEYHEDFFGRDHTTLEQDGKFLIVNGYNALSPKVIWQQTVNVEPHTNYYYSAWARNLNDKPPFAKLRFEVNGVPVGTTADLSQADKAGNNDEISINNWIRFYFGHDESWNSGEATTAIIKIINLETSPAGNDFGLDDISFATISPFVTGPEVPGSDQQLDVCANTEIAPILYKVGTGAAGPKVAGLPPGVTYDFDGLNLKITGSPTNTGRIDSVYTYLISTEACNGNPKAATGTIVVKPKATLTPMDNNNNQDLCMGTFINAIEYKGSGAITNVEFEELPSGITGNYSNRTATITGSSSNPGTYPYLVRTEGGTCAQDTLTGVITISPESIGGVISSPTICVGQDATISLSGNAGKIQYWEISDDAENWSVIPNSTDKLSLSVKNVRESRFYRASVKNELCSAVVSQTGKIRITNLWEGRVDTLWEKPINWSSGTVPSITDVCSNTVTIPQVPAIRYNPVISSTVSITNLDILLGGNVKVKESGNLQIAGNIKNQGRLDLLEGGLEFNGSNTQNLSGALLVEKTVKSLTVSNSNSLNISNKGGDTLNVSGSLSFGKSDAKLYTGNNITLKSTHDATANVGKVNPNNLITGTFIVERFINTGTNQYGNSHDKSWQLLATPVKNVSIKDSWQEGAKPISGVANQKIENPNPGYGTLLTTGRNNVPTNGFDAYTAPGPSLKSFVSETNNWDAGPVKTTDPLYNEKGYMIMVRGDRSVYAYNQKATPTVLRAKGNIITGPTTAISVPANSFQSVGNPYPSAIQIDAITKTGGLKDFIIVWDPTLSGGYGLGAFVTLSPKGNGIYEAVPSTGLYNGEITSIQSGQAFMVQTTENSSGTISFTENAKSSDSRLVMRTNQRGGRSSALRLNLYDGNNMIADGVKVQFADDFSNEIDRFDARKMINSSENLSISSKNKLLVIESRKPVTEIDTIFLNLTGVRASKYQFEFDPTGMESMNVQAFLEDSYNNTKTPVSLLEKSVYDFNIENIPGSYASKRFRIVFKQAAVPPLASVRLKAQVVREGIDVSWNTKNAAGVKEYGVERSFDGINFQTVFSIEKNVAANYSWIDENVEAGTRYYRISATDKSGTIILSNIVPVEIEGKSDISIFPNPIVNNQVQVHLSYVKKGKYVIRIVDPQGRLVMSKEVEHSGGKTSHKLPWDYKLARGIYQIEVLEPHGSMQTFKVKY